MDAKELDELEWWVQSGVNLTPGRSKQLLSLIAAARELEAVGKTLAGVDRDSENTASLSVQKLVLEMLTRERQRDEAAVELEKARDWLGQIADLVQSEDEDIEPDITLARLRGVLDFSEESTK